MVAAGHISVSAPPLTFRNLPPVDDWAFYPRTDRLRTKMDAEMRCGNSRADAACALRAIPAEQIIESHGSVEPPDFFPNAVGSQQIAHPSMGPDNAQRNATGGKFAMQL